MAATTSMPGRARLCGGLTLVELLMALAIVGLVAAAAASLLFSVAQATAARNDLRTLTVRQAVIEGRLSAAARSSIKVLAVGNNYIVLWMADANGDGQVNISEMRRIEWDSPQDQLVSYVAAFPGNWTPQQIQAVDLAYPLSSDFNQITTTLKGQTWFPATPWATGITAMSFSVNPASAESATLISYQATLQTQAQSVLMVGAAALREPSSGGVIPASTSSSSSDGTTNNASSGDSQDADSTNGYGWHWSGGGWYWGRGHNEGGNGS